jgi:hypothetical protein
MVTACRYIPSARNDNAVSSRHDLLHTGSMETRGPLPGNAPVSVTRTDTATSAWQVGQILRAVPLSGTPGGQTQLLIGNQLVQGQSPIPLPAGQPVSLQVESLVPQPLLRILPAPGADPVADAIRTILPRQGALSPLLSNLAQLGNARPAVLPPLLQALSRTLLRQLPDSRSVSTAPGLRQAVAQAGLFMEAKLGNARGGGRVDLGTDLKANLLRLVHLVRNWPGVQGTSAASPRAAPASPAPLPTAPTAAPAPATTAGPPAASHPQVPLSPVTTAAPVLAGTSPAPAPGRTPTAPGPAPGGTQPPPLPPGQSGTPAPATLARGLRAAVPLPGGSQGPATPPAAMPVTPASALARVLSIANTGFALHAPPPLRGQPPQPQARIQASLQAQMPAALLRSELLQQAEASVARVQLSQLASLPQGRDTGLEWLLDLPVRRGEETDVWSLGIRRDDQAGGRGQHTGGPLWTVQLAFDLPGLGPMQARVSLRGEQVSTWFWATREEALPLLQQHLQELRRELEGSGLQVAELHCLRGPMPEAAGTGKPRPPILDERV